MHHSEYAIRILAEQRSAEFIAQSQRLHQLHDVRQRRKYLRSLLTRFHRPVPDRAVVDLREPSLPEPAPNPAGVTDEAEGSTVTLHSGRRP